MANSERKILRGVRYGNKRSKTYLPGMEDELNAVLSSEEAGRLSAKGYIEGKWSGQAEKETESKSGSLDDVDLSTLKKDELLTKAESLGVAVDPSMTKAEIVQAIEAHKEK